MADKDLENTKKEVETSTKNVEQDISQEILDYIEAVRTLASNKSDLVFNNSTPKHAAIVLTTMLEYSKDEMRIFDDNLSGDITNHHPEFIVALQSFIKSGKKLKVVVDNVARTDSKVYTTLQELNSCYPKTVEVRRSTEKFKKSIAGISKESSPKNFAVSDDDGFRLEEQIGTDERKALCSFNNKNVAGKLKKAFDKEFAGCTSIF